MTTWPRQKFHWKKKLFHSLENAIDISISLNFSSVNRKVFEGITYVRQVMVQVIGNKSFKQVRVQEDALMKSEKGLGKGLGKGLETERGEAAG